MTYLFRAPWLIAGVVLPWFYATFPAIAQPQDRPSLAVQPCASRQRGLHLPRPETYPASSPSGTATHRPVLASRWDRQFRTMIRDAAAAGPDFAGHYAVAKWGCGTGCLEFVIVDLSSGKVFDPAFREVDFHYPVNSSNPENPGWTCYGDLVNYVRSSRLMVIEGCLAGQRCGRHFFKMTDAGLQPLGFDPDLDVKAPTRP